MQQEVQGDLSGVQYLFSHEGELLNISVLKLRFYESRTIETGHIVLGSVGALPLVLSYDLFSLVVDVVDWSAFWFSISKVESPEHGDGSKVLVVNEIVIILFIEGE